LQGTSGQVNTVFFSAEGNQGTLIPSAFHPSRGGQARCGLLGTSLNSKITQRKGAEKREWELGNRNIKADELIKTGNKKGCIFLVI